MVRESTKKEMEEHRAASLDETEQTEHATGRSRYLDVLL